MSNSRAISINVNYRFKNLYTSVSRYKDILGGRGRGGSHTGTDYFIYLMTRPKYFRGCLLRYTSSDVRLSLFQGIKDRIRQNPSFDVKDFKFNENQMTVTYIPTGNSIISKGVAKDTGRVASMKSVEGITAVLVEEADEIPESDFDMLDLSLRTTEATEIEIVRIFNPPHKNHWIWRDYILHDIQIPIRGVNQTFYWPEPKKGSNITMLFGTYYDNIQNIEETTRQKFEGFLHTNPEYYWTIIRGYITDGAKGRIYEGWKFITDEEFEKMDLPVIYGLDFGYSIDPCALVKRKHIGEERFYRELIYQPGLGDLELAKRMRDLGIKQTDLIIADYGNGGDLRIAQLRRGWGNQIEGYPDLRFNIQPTYKGAINVGISKVKECRNYITEGSANLAEEVRNYRWALDINKNPTDRPIDTHNHCLDAIRYMELLKGRSW